VRRSVVALPALGFAAAAAGYTFLNATTVAVAWGHGPVPLRRHLRRLRLRPDGRVLHARADHGVRLQHQRIGWRQRRRVGVAHVPITRTTKIAVYYTRMHGIRAILRRKQRSWCSEEPCHQAYRPSGRSDTSLPWSRLITRWRMASTMMALFMIANTVTPVRLTLSRNVTIRPWLVGSTPLAGPSRRRTVGWWTSARLMAMTRDSYAVYCRAERRGRPSSPSNSINHGTTTACR
jgi:hypothetical protein